MTYDFPNDYFSLSSPNGQNPYTETQVIEVRTDRRETPASSQSLQAHSIESSSHRLRSEKLRFLDIEEWDEQNSYDEDEPSCLHYSIEWKVLVNNRKISNDTEQDLVLAPRSYWHMILKDKLSKLLQTKVSPNRNIRCDDTSVVTSVSDRSQRDLTKRFENTNVDWSGIEKQLIEWGELFRYGKKLRISMSFNYVESQPPSSVSKSGTKRGSSATQRMLSDRAAQLDAEENSSGHPSVWRDVYALMQCPGPPCDLGPHCWRDPFGKKHYKLRSHHLRALVERVERGESLQSHDDVPIEIREQLVAEEQQRLARQSNQTASAPTPFPPINITNVLPPSNQSSIASSVESSTCSLAGVTSFCSLNIPGTLDSAVISYSQWLQSNFTREDLKLEVQKICDAALDEGMDLEQIYTDQDTNFFIQEKKIKRGITRRFVNDIPEFAKRQKQYHNVELE
jgi:hypothetical protein